LNNVTSIGGSLWIEGNAALTSLSGLDNVTSIGGNLYIGSVDALTSLTGLDNVTSIGGGLQIGGGWYGNPSLTSLTGLESLTSIGGYLLIEGNPSLTSLSGLDNVTSIGGYLWIEGNDVLTSLSGLDNIESSTIENLYISNNYSLSTCEVQSICDYLAEPNGDIWIENNAEECNSQQEVEEACASSINEIDLLKGLTITPNPFTTSTTLSYELKQPEKVSLRIYSQMGKQVYQAIENQLQGKQQLIWNAEGYANGVYYYRLQVGEQIANGKMVKVR